MKTKDEHARPSVLGCTVLRYRCDISVANGGRARAHIARHLEDRNVVVDFGAMLLCNALGYPDNVPALLLLQLQVGVEDAEMELLNECVHIQFHL